MVAQTSVKRTKRKHIKKGQQNNPSDIQYIPFSRKDIMAPIAPNPRAEELPNILGVDTSDSFIPEVPQPSTVPQHPSGSAPSPSGRAPKKPPKTKKSKPTVPAETPPDTTEPKPTVPAEKPPETQFTLSSRGGGWGTLGAIKGFLGSEKIPWLTGGALLGAIVLSLLEASKKSKERNYLVSSLLGLLLGGGLGLGAYYAYPHLKQLLPGDK